MNKLNEAVAELEFIRTATPWDLVSYVKEHHFRPRSEKPFVERCLKDSSPLLQNFPKLEKNEANQLKEAVLIYINLYGLRASAATVVFQLNVPEAVEAVLARNVGKDRDRDVITSFLDNGSYRRVKAYVDENEVSELDEQEALARFDKNELKELINAGGLSPFAKADILMRGGYELAEEVVRKGQLQAREVKILWKCGAKNACKAFLENLTGKQWRIYQSMYTIRFGKPKALMDMISEKRLHREAELFFFEYAPFEAVMCYVRHYNPEGGEYALLTHPHPTQLICYLSKTKLSSKGERYLLKCRGRHEEVKAYIKTHALDPENERRFVMRKRHREMVLYLSKHYLSAEGQLALIENNNAAEIMYMIETAYWTFPEATEVAIYNHPNSEFWEAYYSKRYVV